MRGQGKWLADRLDEGVNSFNLVRLIAALSVLISHSYPLAIGRTAEEPLSRSTAYTLGQHAVNVFFVVSGLMLARSLARNPNVVRFAWARILRIVPGLFVYGLVFSFIIGALTTPHDLHYYFTDIHTYSYPFSVVFNFNRAVASDGVFSNAPIGALINDPLWTIFYEITAYFILVVFFVLGILKSPFHAAFWLSVALVLMVVFETYAPPMPDFALGHNLVRYGLCFMIGVTAFHYRFYVPISPVYLIPTVVILVLLNDTPLAKPAYFLFAAQFAFVVGTTNFGTLTRLTSRDDISYGTYLYGWPLQQTMITTIPSLGVFGLMTLSLMLIPIAGFLSWKMIEAPALKFKR